MASTLTKILVHITFATKHRAPLIASSIETDLYSFTGGICRDLESPLLAMGGVEDHVHMLVSVSKKMALSTLLLEVKRGSSGWMKRAGVREFDWQDGYFGFSISESGVEPLRAYFAKQKEHHKTVDFRDEMRSLMRKYGVEWDERYVWD